MAQGSGVDSKRLSLVSLSSKGILFLYLKYILIIDIINGAILYYLPFTSSFSFGNVIRIIVFILVFFKLARLKNTYLTTWLFSSIILAICYLLIFYGYNTGKVKPAIYETSYLVKLLLYTYLIFYFIFCRPSKEEVSKIINFNLVVFSSVIIFSYLTGAGFSSYNEGYYSSSKGFFHGNNPTAIVTLTLGYYYSFINKNRLKYFLIILTGFFTGSKVFIIVIFFYGFDFMRGLVSSFKSLKISLIIYVTVIVVFFLSIGYLYQKIWEERYYQRAKTVIYNSKKTGILNTDNILGLYAFVSFDRAYNAIHALEYLEENPKGYLMGHGAYLTHHDIFRRKEHLENDFFNLLSMYGVVGLITYFMFHISLLLRVRWSVRFLVLILLGYAVTAGHFMFPPMSNTLLAVLIGFSYNNNRYEKRK